MAGSDGSPVTDHQSPITSHQFTDFPRLVNSLRFLYSSCTTFFYFCGAMVQRLARGPFKAKMRVRFPLALPTSVADPTLR